MNPENNFEEEKSEGTISKQQACCWEGAATVEERP
jgi:hypothetical protein